MRHFIQMSLRVYRQVSPLGEVLPEQAVGVLTLPQTARIKEVNSDVGYQAKPPIIREFLAAIPRLRLLCRTETSMNTPHYQNTLHLPVEDKVLR
jgi:hypothetical protein